MREFTPEELFDIFIEAAEQTSDYCEANGIQEWDMRYDPVIGEHGDYTEEALAIYNAKIENLKAQKRG